MRPSAEICLQKILRRSSAKADIRGRSIEDFQEIFSPLKIFHRRPLGGIIFIDHLQDTFS